MLECFKLAKVGCLDISNGLNTKVAPRGLNHLLFIKNIKTVKESF